LSLNAKEVAEILKALEASSFDTLELEMGGVKLSLRRSGAALPRTTSSTTPGPAVPAQSPVPSTTSPSPSSVAPVEVPAGAQVVTAPLLGVFYRAPKPGEAPYVEVGHRVRADTIIGIIEVMKLMNTVRAGLSGEILAIPARNGELVEYGEALLFVRPD
jgi:acetyl-CoA carboxylase biotin carboxyl carrier protein